MQMTQEDAGEKRICTVRKQNCRGIGAVSGRTPGPPKFCVLLVGACRWMIHSSAYRWSTSSTSVGTTDKNIAHLSCEQEAILGDFLRVLRPYVGNMTAQ